MHFKIALLISENNSFWIRFGNALDLEVKLSPLGVYTVESARQRTELEVQGV